MGRPRLGAAQLLGAIPFGPLSVAGTMTDLAFRAQTGAGLAENGLAMIFGGGPATEEIATASGRTQTAEALQIRLQGSGFPNELLQMLPYLVTMLALAGFIGRAVPPRSVGVPYDPEHHG